MAPRASAIIQHGPDANFCEPSGNTAEGFSASPASGPFDFGSPEDYAMLKAANFPNEGGPAIVAIELTDDQADSMIGALGQLVPDKALNVGAEIRFEPGGGLEALVAAWPQVQKWIITV